MYFISAKAIVEILRTEARQEEWVHQRGGKGRNSRGEATPFYAIISSW